MAWAASHTPETDALLKRLWADLTLSKAQVAARVGCSAPTLERWAVRLRLGERPRKGGSRPATAGASRPPPGPPPELVPATAVVLADLADGCCGFPVGPNPPIGRGDLQLMCGADREKQEGRRRERYCSGHMNVVDPKGRRFR